MSQFTAVDETFTGKAYNASVHKTGQSSDHSTAGKHLLQNASKIVNELEIVADQIENSKRKVLLIKVLPAYRVFEELIVYYGITQLLRFIKENEFHSLKDIIAALPAKPVRGAWINTGGQLIPEETINTLKEKIRNGRIKSWDAVHEFYQAQEKNINRKIKPCISLLIRDYRYPLKKWTRTSSPTCLLQ